MEKKVNQANLLGIVRGVQGGPDGISSALLWGENILEIILTSTEAERTWFFPIMKMKLHNPVVCQVARLLRFWVHNGFVNVDKEKMSKSLGNFFTLRDIYKKFHPEALRLFLISSHYRSPIDFSIKNLEDAEKVILRFYEALEQCGIHVVGELQCFSRRDQKPPFFSQMREGNE